MGESLNTSQKDQTPEENVNSQINSRDNEDLLSALYSDDDEKEGFTR